MIRRTIFLSFKFNLGFIIYTKRVSNSRNSFKIPMFFPISRSHYRFKFRSTFTFYISPKFQQISLIHFFPSSLSRYQWNFSPRWISASFSKHNLIPLTQSRHLSNQTPSYIYIYYMCAQFTKINRQSSIRFASFQSGFIVNLSSINQPDIQEFSIRKLIDPSIFMNDRWFQQLYKLEVRRKNHPLCR